MTAPAMRLALAGAFAAQPPEYRSFFGVTTSPGKRATVFVWHNYFTGAWGQLGRVPPSELVDVTLAILDELRALRLPERKTAQYVPTLRRRTA